jgi:hypothetical protein
MRSRRIAVERWTQSQYPDCHIKHHCSRAAEITALDGSVHHHFAIWHQLTLAVGDGHRTVTLFTDGQRVHPMESLMSIRFK